jgi:hypothetical protein
MIAFLHSRGPFGPLDPVFGLLGYVIAIAAIAMLAYLFPLQFARCHRAEQHGYKSGR